MVNWLEPCSCRPEVATEPQHRGALIAGLVLVLASGCGRAADPASASAARDAAAPGEALCASAEEGSLRARLQGAIEAELDWSAVNEAQCRGGVRPEGEGLRLVYRGRTAGHEPLLVVLGAGPLRPGESARSVPVNLTIVREGTGEFFATQGDGKCAFDEVRQSPAAAGGSYRLEGRGYCTQPARSVGGDRAVLVSRFDVTAIVDGPGAEATADTGAP